eukprot:scaffold8324_cov70-Cylindrotheca_fusiformis.AAC.1
MDSIQANKAGVRYHRDTPSRSCPQPIDRDIRFRKVVPLKSRSVDDMLEAMDEVFRVYNHAGFRITHVDVDREFGPLLRG